MKTFEDKDVLKLTVKEVIKICNDSSCEDCVFCQDWSGDYNNCSFGMFPADWDLMIKLNKTLMPKSL